MNIENNKSGKARAEDQGFAVKQQSLSSHSTGPARKAAHAAELQQ